MIRTISLVQSVHIASPCSAKWDDMVGDDRVRFCDSCKLNVYNLSAMSESEGEALIRNAEGRLCARVYRRADGTVLTKNCPVGLKAIRRRMIWLAAKCAAALGFVITSTVYAMGSKDPSRDEGVMEMGDAAFPRLESTYQQAAGTVNRWIAAEPAQTQTFIMGKVAPLPQIAEQMSELFQAAQPDEKAR